MVHEATQGEGIWKLAKWGHTSKGPEALPVMPPLITAEGTAYTLEEKVEALRQRFYPTIEADLSDIADTSFEDSTFPLSLEVSDTVEPQEITSLLRTRRPHRAPGSDSIPNEFLKAMGEPLTVAVAALATACWKIGHYPKQLKLARTVALRKPGKAAYNTPGAWRLIALLNTVGKLIEAITAKRIQKAAEEHHLLPASQMGVRKGCSTETALELLVEQVQTVWTSNKHVTSLLSLDISGAFDTVNPIRMLDTLRKKGLPGWLVRWVRSFMSGRTTTLVVQGHETEPFEITAGVPQGSTLFPILFILYNAELMELCDRPNERLSALGFSDGVNILTYSRSTETNCRTLEIAHSRCIEWAKRHGMHFAPKKYELIHFTRSRTKFNLQAGIDVGQGPLSPLPDIRVLGVWLDTKLRWSAHIREIQKKTLSQLGALTRIAASTWGASFVRARQIYMAVCWPNKGSQ